MDDVLRRILSRVQKPGRYTGGEPGSITKDKAQALLRFAFCFPDTYEVGMSYLGMKILYALLNAMDGVWCERAFMPWVDMADEMKKEKKPLYALESQDPLSMFDAVGFTLQYELSYTNVLAMLDMAGIPLRAATRDGRYPLVLGGGPCACNAEPVADFFDALLLGEGERQLPLVYNVLAAGKEEQKGKDEILRLLSEIPGIYIPSLYTVRYRACGAVESVSANKTAASAKAPIPVYKALLEDFSAFPPTEDFVVPMVGAVHDRAQIEVLRGCVRGCRFCQAGFIYRPMRQRPAKMLNAAARRLCDNTGYEELSLTSLSTSDHTELEPMMDTMLSWTQEKRINLALPSLRADNFTKALADKVAKVRKSGLTFAPEAGTQRLRDVINKNITDAEIDRTCTLAFGAGYTAVKLYFMMGLPTETMADIEGIAACARRVVDIYYQNPNRKKGCGVRVNISVACFVPKAMTPFQYCGQASENHLREKQEYLLSLVKSDKRISLSWHDSRTSFLEAVFARGDRRLSGVIEAAYRAGCRFDGWDDQFRYDIWLRAFEDAGIDPHFYAARTIDMGEVTPWSHLHYGVDESFLRDEYRRAMSGLTTPPCSVSCSGCGANKLAKEGVCFGAG